MIRRWWLGAAVVCLLASGLLAREGTLKTNDGRSLQGDIDESSPDGLSVSVTLHGATITVPRTDVASINYSDENYQDFQQKLSKLDPNDVAGRIDLGNQALRDGNYNEATAAARDAQRLDPHDPDAQILLDTIASQKALAAKQAAGAAPAMSPPVAAAPTTAPSVAGPDAWKYLSDDDIQAIRRTELLPADNVRVQFLNNVRKRYLAVAGIDSAAFDGETPTNQALDIFEMADPHLSKDVKFESDPSVLLHYRLRVQPRILAACAVSGCHGGAASGGFYLFPDAEKTAPAYTNFYILTQTARKVSAGDIFGSGPVVRSMIDRVHAGSSLLLQYGLPRSVALIPHPAVAGFNPMFHSEVDPGFVEISNWIGSLKPLAPDYGIQFTIPTAKPATRPSTDATANPG